VCRNASRDARLEQLDAALGLAVAPAAASDHVAPSDLDGNGTANDPYVVTNASELQAIEDDLGANYTLGNDVDASGTSSWNSGDGFEASSHGVAGPPSDDACSSPYRDTPRTSGETDIG
jgi:hypothetical protein